jgi:dihydropyrimidinase
MDLTTFVALTATNPAKMYGLHPRKGTIAVGSDADIAIWDPDKKVTVTYDLLHDNSGYTPYEGRVVTGWPVTVLSRGRVVVRDGALQAERGSGTFIPCAHPRPAIPTGHPVAEANPATNFGANLIAPAWAERVGSGDEPG